MKLDLPHTAVLSMDCQYDICHPDGAFGGPVPAQLQRRGTLATIRACLESARQGGVAVSHVRHLADPATHESDARIFRGMRRCGALQAGSPGAAILPDVAPKTGEVVIDKHRISAFAGTGLDRRLRQAGVDTVVLTGVTTNFVVEGTARDAVDRGFRTVVVGDACASVSDEAHRVSLGTVLSLLAEVVTAAEISPILAGRAPESRSDHER